MSGAADSAAVVTLRSAYGAHEVLDRLETVVRAHGLTVFARIDFSRDAASVGLALSPMAQLVFGSPRAGTPIMTAVPLAALELPLRALAWTDASGQTWLSYADPRALATTYGVPEDLLAALEGIHALCGAAVA